MPPKPSGFPVPQRQPARTATKVLRLLLGVILVLVAVGAFWGGIAIFRNFTKEYWSVPAFLACAGALALLRAMFRKPRPRSDPPRIWPAVTMLILGIGGIIAFLAILFVVLRDMH